MFVSDDDEMMMVAVQATLNDDEDDDEDDCIHFPTEEDTVKEKKINRMKSMINYNLNIHDDTCRHVERNYSCIICS